MEFELKDTRSGFGAGLLELGKTNKHNHNGRTAKFDHMYIISNVKYDCKFVSIKNFSYNILLTL